MWCGIDSSSFGYNVNVKLVSDADDAADDCNNALKMDSAIRLLFVGGSNCSAIYTQLLTCLVDIKIIPQYTVYGALDE